MCPKTNACSLTLTPSAKGFLGQLDLSSGRADGTDIGFEIGGEFTSTGNNSRLSGVVSRVNLASSVPGPTTWAMMLVGFGAVGMSMRRRLKAKVQPTYTSLHARSRRKPDQQPALFPVSKRVQLVLGLSSDTTAFLRAVITTGRGDKRVVRRNSLRRVCSR